MTCWLPIGRRQPHEGQLLNLLFHTNWGNRARSRDNQMREAPLNPQPAAGVKMADVTGAVPAAITGCHRGSSPQPVIPIAHVRCLYTDLPGDFNIGTQWASRPALLIECAYRNLDTADWMTHQHAIATRGRPNLRQR